MNQINADLQAVLEALVNAPTECRYHGTEYDKLGMWAGEPRCDSCKQPWRNRRALDAADRARVAALAMTAASAAETPRPSVHSPMTKSYAIDQMTDVEQLRAVAHRMWEAFQASHWQSAHLINALLRGECRACAEVMHGDRERGCNRYVEEQRKVSDGFGSV